MTYLKRTVDDVIAWSRGQVTNPSQDWGNLCQSHCRQAYGVGAWASSAKEAWDRIPSSEKVKGGKPSDAKRGELLYYAGGAYGHVALAIGKSTNDKCLSNDYVRRGWIDEAPRTFPRWGLTYLGRSFWTPSGSLRPDAPSGYWDGTVPPIENVYAAESDGLANKAAWRLACRLADKGFYVGKPADCYAQGYPRKAVEAAEAAYGFTVDGKYGNGLHNRIFP